ncbi:MAG: riboflavin synthase [Alphaproteobacteria bacterium]|nr:riboflavin synthase [Alphaproteobacteria bacterium]
MFTGLVQDIGTITSCERGDGDLSVGIQINLDTSTIDLGASISCSGCCLTVVKKEDNILYFEVSNETLSCTTIGEWKEGMLVNIERSLKVGDELGGHFVSGHIDAVTTVISIESDDGSHRITFKQPQNLEYLIAAKGSIALDGVSLTVNNVTSQNFSVNIIPHTWEHTTFKTLKAGSKVNLEIDMLARYMDRALKCKEML